MTERIAVIDYGSGNLRSVEKAMQRAVADGGIDARVDVVSDGDSVRSASRIVLPGVGAFADCMSGLSSLPGVLDAIRDADTVIVCPSNPLISIGPILAVPGVRDALIAARDRVVAVSPLISGRAVKGPADRMLSALGIETSCVGVARLYADWCSTIVIDDEDADRADAIAALGLRPVVTDTLMRDARIAAALARSTLAAVGA